MRTKLGNVDQYSAEFLIGLGELTSNYKLLNHLLNRLGGFEYRFLLFLLDYIDNRFSSLDEYGNQLYSELLDHRIKLVDFLSKPSFDYEMKITNEQEQQLVEKFNDECVILLEELVLSIKTYLLQYLDEIE